MRVLFWYCQSFDWRPALKTLDDAPPAGADGCKQAVVAFIHVEPGDVEPGAQARKKLLKNAKWLAGKWDTRTIVLHSFTHLGEQKADAAAAHELILAVGERLQAADYSVLHTPYGYFSDIRIDAPGHPLARIYKEF